MGRLISRFRIGMPTSISNFTRVIYLFDFFFFYTNSCTTLKRNKMKIIFIFLAKIQIFVVQLECV